MVFVLSIFIFTIYSELYVFLQTKSFTSTPLFFDIEPSFTNGSYINYFIDIGLISFWEVLNYYPFVYGLILYPFSDLFREVVSSIGLIVSSLRVIIISPLFTFNFGSTLLWHFNLTYFTFSNHYGSQQFLHLHLHFTKLRSPTNRQRNSKFVYGWYTR